MQKLNLYDERKTSQAAAFLLYKAGGVLSYLKLLKLLYIADRESFKQYGEPISGDSYYSMPNGPVLSTTYDRIKGKGITPNSYWALYISAKDKEWNVSANRIISDPSEELLALSDSDISILNQVYENHSNDSKWDMVKYTHEEFEEWEDPFPNRRRPLSYERILAKIGYSEEEISATMDYLKERSAMNTELP